MSYTETISADALAAWLLLRDEGGYWTAAEVASALCPNDPSQVGSIRSARWMSALLRRRFVAVSPTAARSAAYGVTHRCTAPPGYSVDPALNLFECQGATV